jgi:methane/ammonia monooxygenase subunit B
MSLDNNDAIKPGEQRTLTMIVKDGLWESEKLDGLIRDADSRIGGLLFLYDLTGKRYISSITAAVIPKFD